MFLKLSLPAIACLAAVLNAQAETLIVAVPQSEYPVLASQMLDGAKAALAGNWVIEPVDAICAGPNVAAVARNIMEKAPDAVIGLPCIAPLLAVLPVLGPKSIPIVTIASRADGPAQLALKNKWPLYRVGPRERAEIEAISKLIIDAWKDVPFAILDDGTLFARDTAEALRNAGETSGIKPVLVEGFQPQLENQKQLIAKLAASGATHVFIASDRGNIAQIAAEAAALNITIAGPETLRANELDFPLPKGVLMVARDMVLSSETMEKIAAVRQTPFALVEGYVGDAFIATELAMQLHADPTSRQFATLAGDLKVADDGFLEPANFALFMFDGKTFQKVAP